MKVKLFGNLRQKAGKNELMASGVTILKALESLCADNEPLHTAIFAGAGLRPHIRVMVNGLDCELADGLETAVSEQDTIAVFPPIAGG